MARIITRTDALAKGYTDSELRQWCRAGEYTRLHRGSYTLSRDLQGLTDVERHLILARAVLARSTAADSVLSHVSAAIAHNIDVWNVPLGTVQLTRNRRSGGRKDARRQVHAAPYDEDEVCEVDGLRVTTPTRTIADLACSLPFEEAVCAADDAARRLGVTGADVAALLERRPGRAGHPRARRVARFMDGCAESVGESRSRVLLHEAGFTPSLQRVLNCGNNNYRVDFFLDESNVVGEFDGRVKYGRLVPSGDTPADVLWREKLREDRLRDAGYEIARWTWADLRIPAAVVERVSRAQARSAARSM